MSRIVTLDEFIFRRQKEFPFASGELTNLLRDIGVAAKIVNREVNKAGLLNILGAADQKNTSGDSVQKLDLYANDKFIESLQNSGEVCGIGSEENEDFIAIPPIEGKAAKYIVVFDPLDGSTNIDVNVSVGTIFGIYRRLSDTSGPVDVEDFLQNGTELVAAGYVLYGTSTLLVYTTGSGVNGFTLDPTIGEFCLSHLNIQIPNRGDFYSVNQGNYLKFDVEMRRYIDHCSESNFRLRYIGSMVADIHRILFQGGIFLYPNTREYPKGKLRIVYECNPLAYIVEQAGGKAISGQLDRLLEVEVKGLHQKESVAMGSPDMVDEMADFVKRYLDD